MVSRPSRLPFLIALSGCGVPGDGILAEETRTVAAFSAVSANNGVQLDLIIDPEVTGEVDLHLSAESNLLELITAEVIAGTLFVDLSQRVAETLPISLSATTSELGAVDANNGAIVGAVGVADHLALVVNNGASFVGGEFEVETASVDINNGGEATVCATGQATGAVANGAELTVLCGGDASGVKVKSGGALL